MDAVTHFKHLFSSTEFGLSSMLWAAVVIARVTFQHDNHLVVILNMMDTA